MSAFEYLKDGASASVDGWLVEAVDSTEVFVVATCSSPLASAIALRLGAVKLECVEIDANLNRRQK